MKIFDLYDISEVKVQDPALRKYINLDARLVLKSHGRNTEKFGKIRVNIIERFASLLAVPGHRSKKHKQINSWSSGKYSRNMKTVLETFKIINEKTKENPIAVLVRAIENCCPCDEVTAIEYGGARYPQAVDVSPMRRLTLALRNLIHGASDKAFGKKTNIADALATEIILASQKNNEAFAYQKRVETEKQADAAR